MTGQSILNLMELIDRELQLQPGEDDVTRGLLALNAGQDYLETILVGFPDIAGSSVGTVTTTAGVETTTFPTGVLRIDRLQLLDGSGSVIRDLDPIKRTGGHAPAASWPLSLGVSSTTGTPVAYWTNRAAIYWKPRPSAVSTIRYYGFARASDITAGGTFAYDDSFALPLAAFAARFVKTGIEDGVTDLAELATQLFVPAIRAAAGYNRDGASPLIHSRVHDA